MNPTANLFLPLVFPFIRFTNWKQGSQWRNSHKLWKKSFHSYASRIGSKRGVRNGTFGPLGVSIHTLHELEARNFLSEVGRGDVASFHSYASRIGSKIDIVSIEILKGLFPFIRFTNWKQEVLIVGRGDYGVFTFPFIRFTNWKQAAPPPRDGGYVSVSIHTLHELEASSILLQKLSKNPMSFHSYASRIGSKPNSLGKEGLTK